jgi:hypothetical protein
MQREILFVAVRSTACSARFERPQEEPDRIRDHCVASSAAGSGGHGTADGTADDGADNLGVVFGSHGGASHGVVQELRPSPANAAAGRRRPRQQWPTYRSSPHAALPGSRRHNRASHRSPRRTRRPAHRHVAAVASETAPTPRAPPPQRQESRPACHRSRDRKCHTRRGQPRDILRSRQVVAAGHEQRASRRQQPLPRAVTTTLRRSGNCRHAKPDRLNAHHRPPDKLSLTVCRAVMIICQSDARNGCPTD